MFSFGFYHTVSKPTRISDTSASAIDHIITNRSLTNIESVILVSDISDHFPVFHFLPCKRYQNNDPKTFTAHNFSKRNLDNFHVALSNINWDSMYESTNAQNAFDIFEDNFLTLYNMYFPQNKVKFNRNIHKVEAWLSKGLLISRTEKNRLFKLKLSSPSYESNTKFKVYHNMYNHLTRSAKKLHYEKQILKFQANQKNPGPRGSWYFLCVYEGRRCELNPL